MMVRKILSLVLAGVFLFSSLVSAAESGEKTVVENLAAIESEVYGSVRTGSIIDRLNGVETELYDKVSSGAVIERASSLYGKLFDNTGAETSFMMRINAVEWALSRNLTYEPLKVRVENLETMIYGAPKEGCLDERMQTLTKLAFASGSVEVSDKVVPANSLVKIKLAEAIDSRTAKVGDSVKYQAAEDVIIDGVLVIASGEKGEGKLTKVKQHQNFGRDAQVEIDFGSLEAIDGSRMDVFLGDEAKAKMEESLAMAAGASIAGMAILGPVGIVGGAFVKGKAVELPVGTELYVQTKSESVVYGFNTGVL